MENGSQEGLSVMVYLDHAAAARPPREVLEYFSSLLAEEFANQEAAHRLGYEARRRLDAAAERLAGALFGKGEYAVVWGMNGTELFRLIADSPVVAGRRGLSSLLEHPALTANLQRTAAGLALLRPRRDGTLIPEAAEAEFAAFHLVQSELGVLQTPESLFASSPGGVRILDAIQGAGRLPLPENAADLYVISGHKFGAPGGAAILVDKHAPCAKSFLEFAHRYRHVEYRCGRPEVPVLLAMVFAAELRCRKMHEALVRVRDLNRFLRDALSRVELPGGGRCFCTIPEETASPYILHVMLPGVESGVVVRMLSEAGIMVAAGSACSSESRESSAALRALGYRGRDAWSGLRVSLSPESTVDDGKKLVEALRNVLKNW